MKMNDDLRARPIGTPDVFRSLVVRPHPRLDPPGTRCRVEGVEIRNPASVRAEAPLPSTEPEPTTSRGRGRPKSTVPSRTAQTILGLLRKCPQGLTRTEIYHRLSALGFGAISRQCISYHLGKLCEMRLARRSIREHQGPARRTRIFKPVR